MGLNSARDIVIAHNGRGSVMETGTSSFSSKLSREKWHPPGLPFAWVDAGEPTEIEKRRMVSGVRSWDYSLQLLQQKWLLPRETLAQIREETMLTDFFWRMSFSRRLLKSVRGSKKQALIKAEALVLFEHGWCGCADIWEDLCNLICQQNPGVIAVAIDVPGFFRSPFIDDREIAGRFYTSEGMNWTLEEMLKVGLGFEDEELGGKPQVTVAHSMRAAAQLDKKAETLTRKDRGFLLLAPALVSEDLARSRLYRFLGLASLGEISDFVRRFEDNILARQIVERLVSGASEAVKEKHRQVFENTSKRTIGSTIAFLSKQDRPWKGQDVEIKSTNTKALLGIEDRLVGLVPTETLLLDLGFDPGQIMRFQGDHYFFSVDTSDRDSLGNLQQVVNRDLVVEEIEALLTQAGWKKYL
jgi:pimeloyl-ACP methyl ester carboxylesterase